MVIPTETHNRVGSDRKRDHHALPKKKKKKGFAPSSLGRAVRTIVSTAARQLGAIPRPIRPGSRGTV